MEVKLKAFMTFAREFLHVKRLWKISKNYNFFKYILFAF